MRVGRGTGLSLLRVGLALARLWLRREDAGARPAHLHDKLPASWEAPLGEQHVLRLLLLLRLLDLGQSADRVHPLAIVRAAL